MRIAVGMSGGVDSTIAAALLLQQGHEIIGLTMAVWDSSTGGKANHTKSACYSPREPEELETIAKLAERLGIEHHVISLAQEYTNNVLDYFRQEYLAGRTPNPCVMCNRTIKFEQLLLKAHTSGIKFDMFATGHYARVEYDSQRGRYLLKKGVDTYKDQSYFLACLEQEQLAHVIFPLGNLTKAQVRDIARYSGFSELAEQPESQDFTGTDGYAFLFEGIDAKPGPVVDINGNVIGTHRGVMYYTIGQRKGVLVGGTSQPMYVLKIDSRQNTIVVGPYEKLLAGGLVADELNWIAIDSLDVHTRANVKIRSPACEAPALLYPEVSDAAKTIRVMFDEPQFAVTPGQLAVFYDGDIVLGSGWIRSAIQTDDK